jgi:hypothetical protein
VARRALTLVPVFILLAGMLTLYAQQPTPAPESPSPGNVQSAPDADAFDERAAAATLGIIRDGLEGHSQRRLLAAFDGNKMDSFLTFEDQIEAYFTRYESFRVTLRIIQTSMENDRGIILAEFQLENTPRGGGRISRRQGQLRFELEPSPKGWKIVDFNPRGFFS